MFPAHSGLPKRWGEKKQITEKWQLKTGLETCRGQGRTHRGPFFRSEKQPEEVKRNRRPKSIHMCRNFTNGNAKKGHVLGLVPGQSGKPGDLNVETAKAKKARRLNPWWCSGLRKGKKPGQGVFFRECLPKGTLPRGGKWKRWFRKSKEKTKKTVRNKTNSQLK